MLKHQMSKTKYVYAGKWLGDDIYLEEGMKLDWTTKIPLYFMKILPDRLFGRDNK